MNSKEIENQIIAIPGNKPVLRKLYKFLDKRKVIALVGAGASAGLWPLWEDFLQNLIAHCIDYGALTKNDILYFQSEEVLSEPLVTAQMLREKLSNDNYFDFLRETFKDKNKSDSNGNKDFTIIHKALIQLPICNYVTINYDSGLTNARANVLPDITIPAYLWDQAEADYIVMDNEKEKLILHLHGSHHRAKTIILTLEDYRKAYSYEPFVDLAKNLFKYKTLLIVGFGWRDPYIGRFFDEMKKYPCRVSLNHICIVGLENNDLDMDIIRSKRKMIEMKYGINDILIYPSKDNHKALGTWLQLLVKKYS